MFEFKRLIKESIKAHTFLTDIFAFGLITVGMADKYLANLIRRQKVYSKLYKKYGRYIGKCETNGSAPAEREYVWICWFQGLENAPDIVKECVKSIYYWIKDREIILVTSENYMEYVHFPEFIVEKWEKGVITNAHFSDLLRLELLEQYGGLWLDATVIMTGPLPKYISQSDFFVYRNGWMDNEMMNMANWLMYSKKTNHPILVETSNLLYRYWKEHNYSMNYFIMHLFFRMVSDYYLELWENVPHFNHVDNHLMMEAVLRENNADRICDIKALTPIHKMTYKFTPPADQERYIYHLEKIWGNTAENTEEY